MRRFRVVVILASVLVVEGGCKEEGTIQVHSLTFKGVKAVDQSKLSDALATRRGSRMPWGKKTYFDRARFDADLQRIQAFYADRGYPDARVTGFDVKLNGRQDSVDLAVTIAEGEPVKVAAIHFVGFDVIPAAHFDTLKEHVPLRIGQPRDRQMMASTHEMALNELKDHGYPYAKVDTSEDDGSDGKTATVTLTAAPGKVAHIGPVEIHGNKTVADPVIARQLTFRTGDLYQRSLLQDSQRRLYSMALFQFANVEPLNAEQPSDVPIRITVAEDHHHRVNFGVGYGTEEKGRVDAEYRHLNFLGGARSAGAHVRWSSLDRGVRLDFNQPYFFAPRYSLSGEAQQWYTFTPAYHSVVSGGKVTLTERSRRQTSWSVSMTSEHVSSSIAPSVLNDLTLRNNLIALGLDPRTGEQRGTSNALGFDLQHSTADNPFNAHHGYQVGFHAEQAGRIVPGTFSYSAMSVDGRHYLPIGAKLVLASRVRAGNIHPAGNDQDNVPFSKRYFLGGATSLRGWGQYEVSPLSGSGLPVGGNSLLAFTEELRVEGSGKVGGVLFLDGGNVWADSWGMKLGDLRYAIGPGLRYRTPIGPIRVDVGYQLNPISTLLVNGQPQTRRWRLHFSIGQAF